MPPQLHAADEAAAARRAGASVAVVCGAHEKAAAAAADGGPARADPSWVHEGAGGASAGCRLVQRCGLRPRLEHCILQHNGAHGRERQAGGLNSRKLRKLALHLLLLFSGVHEGF